MIFLAALNWITFILGGAILYTNHKTRRVIADITFVTALYPATLIRRNLDLMIEDPRDCTDPHCYAATAHTGSIPAHQHLTTRRVTAHVLDVTEPR